MEKWYSQNSEIVEAKAGGPVAAAFAVLMGTMGLWQAAEKYKADPQEIQEIVEQNKVQNNGTQWTPEQVAEWDRLQEEEKQKKKTDKIQDEKLNKDINILARTLWGEARGESTEGIKAVASVIWNRGNGDVDKMINVVQKPWQFSMWNDFNWENFEIKEYSGTKWEAIKQIARQMANGSFQPIKSWDHYYAPKGLDVTNPNIVKGPDGKLAPKWAFVDNDYSKYQPFDEIGNHRFMALK